MVANFIHQAALDNLPHKKKKKTAFVNYPELKSLCKAAKYACMVCMD